MPENGSRAGRRAGKSGLRCGGIQRSHNEMDGYAEERRGKFIRFRFAKMAKRLSYWRKRVCVSEVEGISNVVRHWANCEKPNPLTSTDAVAERGMHARSPGRFALGNRPLSFTRADRN